VVGLLHHGVISYRCLVYWVTEVSLTKRRQDEDGGWAGVELEQPRQGGRPAVIYLGTMSDWRDTPVCARLWRLEGEVLLSTWHSIVHRRGVRFTFPVLSGRRNNAHLLPDVSPKEIVDVWWSKMGWPNCNGCCCWHNLSTAATAAGVFTMVRYREVLLVG